MHEYAYLNVRAIAYTSAPDRVSCCEQPRSLRPLPGQAREHRGASCPLETALALLSTSACSCSLTFVVGRRDGFRRDPQQALD